MPAALVRAEFWASSTPRSLRTTAYTATRCRTTGSSPGSSTMPGSRGTGSASPLPPGRHRSPDTTGYTTVTVCGSASPATDLGPLVAYPLAGQQANRVVAVTQPFADAFDPRGVDAHDPQRGPDHARTVAPTARRYSASASSATRGQSCAGAWSRL